MRLPDVIRYAVFPVLILTGCVHRGGGVHLDQHVTLGGLQTWHLHNGTLEAWIAPERGRLFHLGRIGGENLLVSRKDRLEDPDASANTDGWNNPGGEWLWPLTQVRWGDLGLPAWPPPPVLEAAWHAEAARDEFGNPALLMWRVLDSPLSLRVERLFHFCPEQNNRLRIRQTLTRTAVSELPVVLWQITQMDEVDEVWMGRTQPGRFPNGYRLVAFEHPPAAHLHVDEGYVHYIAGAGQEFKIGADGVWIAARRGDDVLLQWTEGGDQGGAFPDGGSSVVLYLRSDDEYAEIETQSVEQHPAVGEQLRNMLFLEVTSAGEFTVPLKP